MNFPQPQADAETLYDPNMGRRGIVVKRGATYVWLESEGVRWRVPLTSWGEPVGGGVNPELVKLAEKAGLIKGATACG